MGAGQRTQRVLGETMKVDEVELAELTALAKTCRTYRLDDNLLNLQLW